MSTHVQRMSARDLTTALRILRRVRKRLTDPEVWLRGSADVLGSHHPRWNDGHAKQFSLLGALHRDSCTRHTSEPTWRVLRVYSAILVASDVLGYTGSDWTTAEKTVAAWCSKRATKHKDVMQLLNTAIENCERLIPCR